MKQKIWIGLGTVILATALSAAASTQAQQDDFEEPSSHASAPTLVASSPAVKLSEPSQILKSVATAAKEVKQKDVVKVGSRPSAPAPASSNAEKVGSPSSSPASETTRADAVAKIQTHKLSGREAATLYVQNIPVLTFVGDKIGSNPTVKMGVPAQNKSNEHGNQNNAIVGAADVPTAPTAPEAAPADVPPPLQDDPIWRASTAAAEINQIYRDKLDPQKITIHWSGQKNKNGQAVRDRYTIKADGKNLVVMDDSVVLPGQAKLKEEGALQATNRLRRLLGNADALKSVADKPKPKAPIQIAFGNVSFSVNGYASYYGPGFHGNLSANGETFNQYAMTAAHRSLPFGTRVRVTNMDNGRSVVVRINDRGPFYGNRIIDLSLGAAEIIGMMGSGVAPVKLDILN
jgi:rare lipoprotein A